MSENVTNPLRGAERPRHIAATHVGAGPLQALVVHTSGAALEMMNPLSLMNVAVESWLKPSERSGAWPLTCAVSSGDKLGDPVFVTEGDVLGLAEFEALGDGDNNGELDGDALNVRREGIVLKKRQLPNIAHTTITTRTHARENIFQRSTDARFSFKLRFRCCLRRCFLLRRASSFFARRVSSFFAHCSSHTIFSSRRRFASSAASAAAPRIFA